MSDTKRDPIDQALKDGLRRLSVPEPGSDFDDRVIFALQVRLPWWQALFSFARPMASAAACSLVATLALMHFTLSSPQSASPAPPAAPSAVSASAPAGQGFTMAALDRALNQPDMRDGTLIRLLTAPPKPSDPLPALPAASPPVPARPPDSSKRDGLAMHQDPFLA